MNNNKCKDCAFFNIIPVSMLISVKYAGIGDCLKNSYSGDTVKKNYKACKDFKQMGVGIYGELRKKK